MWADITADRPEFSVTVSGLPEHAIVRVGMSLGYSGTNDQTSVDTLEVTVAGESAEPFAIGLGATTVYGRQVDSAPRTVTTTHTGGSVTLKLVATGLEADHRDSFYLGNLGVSVFTPTLSISSVGTLGENNTGWAEASVTRDGPPLGDLKVKLDVAAPDDVAPSLIADAGDVEFDDGTIVTIPDGESSATFRIRAVDDGTAEGKPIPPDLGNPNDPADDKPGDPGRREVLDLRAEASDGVAVAAQPQRVVIGEDSNWYYTKWKIKGSKPDPMKTQEYPLGTDSFPPAGMIEPGRNENKTELIYSYYDEWEPRHDWGATSQNYENDSNDINRTFDISYTKLKQHAFSIGGQWKEFAATYQYVTGTEVTQGGSTTFEASAGQDEKVRLIPMVKRRTYVTRSQRYTWVGGSNGSWVKNGDPQVHEEGGLLKNEIGKVVFSHYRVWMDEEEAASKPEFSEGSPQEEPVNIFDDLL